MPDYGRGVDKCPNADGYIAIGWTRSYGSGKEDAWLVRTVEEIPNITVALTPDASTVERGARLGYQVSLTNNTEYPRGFYYWSDVFLLNGDPYKKNPILMKRIWVKAGVTRSGHVSHKVPNNAPLREYSLCGRIGHHSDEMWDESCFDFSEVPGVLGSHGDDNLTDWEVIENTL